MNFSPSVSDSFTRNSSADGPVREKDSDVPLAFDFGLEVCLEHQGKVTCEKRGEKQVKWLHTSPSNMHGPLLSSLCFRQLSLSSQLFCNWAYAQIFPTLLAPFCLSISMLTLLSF